MEPVNSADITNNDGGQQVHVPVKAKRKPFSFYMSVLSLALVAVITSWDATSLAVALPAITSQLQGTTLQSFWANITFILGVAVSQPIYVSVSDVLGRKQPFYASMVLFAAGSVVFAVANSMGVLIAGRLVQGLGAGGLDVLEEIILADITSLKERPKYIGLLAIAIAVGTISGPVVGALFSEFVGWRWIGWVNLPITGAAFLLAFFFLRLRPIEIPLRAKVRRLDWAGMLLFTVGASAVALPLSWAGTLYPWASWRTLAPLLLGLAVLVAFGFYERRPADAIMPYRVFAANATTNLSLATGFLHGAVLYTMLLYLSLFFQAVFLEAPLEAAKSTLPVCCLVVASSFAAPVAIEVTRRYRALLWAGWAFTAVFVGLWCLVGRRTARAEAYAFQAAQGVGIGAVFTATQIPVQAGVARVDDTGLAVGMLVVFRLFGALVGLSVGSTAFSSVFRARFAGLAPALRESVGGGGGLEDASHAVSFIPLLRTLELPSGDLDALVETYRESFRAVWIIMTCVSGAGFFASLFIRELTLEREEMGRQGFEAGSSSTEREREDGTVS